MVVAGLAAYRFSRAGLVDWKSGLPQELALWSGAVLAGSLAGTSLGVRRLPVKPLIWLLAVAVAISDTKFIFL